MKENRHIALLIFICIFVLYPPNILFSLIKFQLGDHNFDGSRYILSKNHNKYNLSINDAIYCVLGMLTPTHSIIKKDVSTISNIQTRFDELAKYNKIFGEWRQFKDIRYDDLEQISAPWIALMRNTHPRILIVLQVNKDYVFANDPEVGKVLYPISLFYANWSKYTYLLGAF